MSFWFVAQCVAAILRKEIYLQLNLFSSFRDCGAERRYSSKPLKLLSYLRTPIPQSPPSPPPHFHVLCICSFFSLFMFLAISDFSCLLELFLGLLSDATTTVSRNMTMRGDIFGKLLNLKGVLVSILSKEVTAFFLNLRKTFAAMAFLSEQTELLLFIFIKLNTYHL